MYTRRPLFFSYILCRVCVREFFDDGLGLVSDGRHDLLPGLQRHFFRRSPEVANWTCAAAASSQGLLYDLSDCHVGWGCIEFYAIQSDPGPILVCSHQWCSGSAGDGSDDASYRGAALGLAALLSAFQFTQGRAREARP
jgi:hypothetical protein